MLSKKPARRLRVIPQKTWGIDNFVDQALSTTKEMSLTDLGDIPDVGDVCPTHIRKTTEWTVEELLWILNIPKSTKVLNCPEGFPAMEIKPSSTSSTDNPVPDTITLTDERKKTLTISRRMDCGWMTETDTDIIA